MFATSILSTLALGALFSSVRAAPHPELTGISYYNARADVCPLYNQADAVHLSTRDYEEIEKRAGEEFWFRFETPDILTSGLNAFKNTGKSTKGFDDQSFKWISTDISKITRGAIKGRVPVMYVLPAGTRAAMLKAAVDFDKAAAKKQINNFVTKDHEPNDIGIQAVIQTNKVTPFDTFKKSVIRAVVKQTSAKAGGKATFTTIDAKNKISSTASKTDQAVMNKVC